MLRVCNAQNYLTHFHGRIFKILVLPQQMDIFIYYGRDKQMSILSHLPFWFGSYSLVLLRDLD